MNSDSIELPKSFLIFLNELKHSYFSTGLESSEVFDKLFKLLFSRQAQENDDMGQLLLQEIKRLRKLNIPITHNEIAEFFLYKLEKASYVDRCSSSNDSLSGISNEESESGMSYKLNPLIIFEENFIRKGIFSEKNVKKRKGKEIKRHLKKKRKIENIEKQNLKRESVDESMNKELKRLKEL